MTPTSSPPGSPWYLVIGWGFLFGVGFALASILVHTLLALFHVG